MNVSSEDSKTEEEIEFEQASEASTNPELETNILFELHEESESSPHIERSYEPALDSQDNTMMSGLASPSAGIDTLTAGTISSTKPPLPRVGGYVQFGSDWIPFSGGGMQDKHRKDRPMATLAFRPKTDLRSLMRVEESSSKPLEEVKRIDEGTSSVTFAHWLNDVQRHFGNTGLDSVAYILKSNVASLPIPDFDGSNVSLDTLKAATTEFDLFTEWGSITKEEIVTFDTWIRVNGDEIDQHNNQYARQFLRGSVGPVLRDRIDRELDIDVSGGRLFYFIIRKLQAVSATSGRQLVEDLQAIKLSAIAGCHVTDCAEKIHNLCTKIHGLGSAHIPPDLSLLVVRCFDTTGIGSFDLEVTKLENQLDDDPSSLQWKDILDKLTHKFDTLRLTKRWPPLAVDTKGKAIATGFAVQINEVRKTLNDVKSQIGSIKNKTNEGKGTGTQDLSSVQCHYCKDKGHYKSDCPVLKKKKEQGGSDEPKDKDDKTKNWKRIPPKEGDSDTKLVNEDGKQVKYKWCMKCRRWTTGTKMHSTMEHKTRKKDGDTPVLTSVNGNSLLPGHEMVSFGLFSGILDNHVDEEHEDLCSTEFLRKLYASSSNDHSADLCNGNWYPSAFTTCPPDKAEHKSDANSCHLLTTDMDNNSEHLEHTTGCEDWTPVTKGTPIKHATYPKGRAGRN